MERVERVKFIGNLDDNNMVAFGCIQGKNKDIMRIDNYHHPPRIGSRNPGKRSVDFSGFKDVNRRVRDLNLNLDVSSSDWASLNKNITLYTQVLFPEIFNALDLPKIVGIVPSAEGLKLVCGNEEAKLEDPLGFGDSLRKLGIAVIEIVQPQALLTLGNFFQIREDLLQAFKIMLLDILEKEEKSQLRLSYSNCINLYTNKKDSSAMRQPFIDEMIKLPPIILSKGQLFSKLEDDPLDRDVLYTLDNEPQFIENVLNRSVELFGQGKIDQALKIGCAKTIYEGFLSLEEKKELLKFLFGQMKKFFLPQPGQKIEDAEKILQAVKNLSLSKEAKRYWLQRTKALVEDLTSESYPRRRETISLALKMSEELFQWGHLMEIGVNLKGLMARRLVEFLDYVCYKEGKEEKRAEAFVCALKLYEYLQEKGGVGLTPGKKLIDKATTILRTQLQARIVKRLGEEADWFGDPKLLEETKKAFWRNASPSSAALSPEALPGPQLPPASDIHPENKDLPGE